MRAFVSLLLCLGLAPLAAFGQDRVLEERQPIPNIHAIGLPDRPSTSSTSSTSVDTETRLEQTEATAVAETGTAKSETDMAETTLTVTQFVHASSPATDVCWGSAGSTSCRQIITDFTGCYTSHGDMVDPNGSDGRGSSFRHCLCIGDKGQVYRDIILNFNTSHSDYVQDCLQCMIQAGIEKPTSVFKWKTHGFCNTAVPHLYDLLTALLGWAKDTNEPSFTEMARISAISTFADRFTSASGMNEATTSGSSTGAVTDTATTTATEEDMPWWQRTLTPGGAIPTEYLAPLPKNWPYTSYGVARRAGLTTSFPLVNPNSTTQTVAWLYHSLLWNPRPLHTPPASKAANATLYQPLLEGWIPSFLDASITAATGTVNAIPSVPNTTSSTTPMSVSSSSSVKSTSSILSTSTSSPSETSTFTIAPPPKPSDPDSPAPPSTTATSLVPMRPTRTQDPPLPLDPDTATAGKEADKVTTKGGMAMAAVPVTTSVPALEDLWNEVQSLRSRLGA